MTAPGSESEVAVSADAAPNGRAASLFERGLPWLWSARTISSLGSTFTALTITLWATIHLHLTGSQLAMVELGPLLVAIVSPLVVGMLVDATDRRVLLSATHVGSAIVLLAAAGLAQSDRLGIVALIAVNALLAIFSTIERPAKFASFFDMVGEDLIDRANGLTQTIGTATDAIGGAAAGIALRVLGAAPLFLLDGLSFIMEAIAPWAVQWANPDAIRPQPQGDKQSYMRRAAGGFTAIGANPLIRTLVLMSTAANGLIAFASVPLTLMMLRKAAIPYLAYTIILSIGSIGALIGGALAARVGKAIGGARAQVLSVLSYGVFMAGYALIGGHGLPWIIYASIIDFGVGMSISIYIVNNATAQHRAITSELRGRVSAARGFIGATVMAAATALGGLLVDRTDPPIMITASALGLLLVAFWGALALR